MADLERWAPALAFRDLHLAWNTPPPRSPHWRKSRHHKSPRFAFGLENLADKAALLQEILSTLDGDPTLQMRIHTMWSPLPAQWVPVPRNRSAQAPVAIA